MSLYLLGWIVGYVIASAVTFTILFWVVRGAILSALSENRRRELYAEEDRAREAAQRARRAERLANQAPPQSFSRH